MLTVPFTVSKKVIAISPLTQKCGFVFISLLL
nr:MAG TPA: hypothetical protein [Caudoviricetes sp.]